MVKGLLFVSWILLLSLSSILRLNLVHNDKNIDVVVIISAPLTHYYVFSHGYFSNMDHRRHRISMQFNAVFGRRIVPGSSSAFAMAKT